MLYEFNGKKIKIPDKEIESNMKLLDITKDEAIEMWLDDHDYTINEEQEKLTQKVKDSGILTTLHGAESNAYKNRGKKKGDRKPDPDKEWIISQVSDFLNNLSDSIINLQITNIGKLITFSYNGEDYELNLIRKRKKKDKK